MKKFSAGRKSKVKNIFGTASQPKENSSGLQAGLSSSSPESTVISCSPSTPGMFCIPWNKTGGAVFVGLYELPAGVPVPLAARRPSAVPALLTGHNQAVLDSSFSPFIIGNSEIEQKSAPGSLLATASGDSTTRVWRLAGDRLIDSAIPTTHKSCEALAKPLAEADLILRGSGRKIQLVQFHPSVDQILATAEVDTVKLWDVTKIGQQRLQMPVHGDLVQSISWSQDGLHFATSCRDKQLRVFDTRSPNACVVQGEVTESVKGFRTQWLRGADRFLCAGFTKTGARCFSVWDLRKGIKRGAISTTVLNEQSSSSQLIPFYDDELGMVYMTGRGDTVLRAFEEDFNEEPYLHQLNEYRSQTTMTGLCMLPKMKCDTVKKFEVAKFLKLQNDHTVEQITFAVPRKTDLTHDDGRLIYHDDLFPPSFAHIPTMSAEEWLGGNGLKEAPRIRKSLMPSSGYISIYETKLRPEPEQDQKAADNLPVDVVIVEPATPEKQTAGNKKQTSAAASAQKQKTASLSTAPAVDNDQQIIVVSHSAVTASESGLLFKASPSSPQLLGHEPALQRRSSMLLHKQKSSQSLSKLEQKQQLLLFRMVNSDDVQGWLWKFNREMDSFKKGWWELQKDGITYGDSKKALVRKKILFSDILYCDYCALTDPFFGEDKIEQVAQRWFRIVTLKRVYHLVAEDVFKCCLFVEGILKQLPQTEMTFEDDFLQAEVSMIAPGQARVIGGRWRYAILARGYLMLYGSKRCSVPLESISFDREVLSVGPSKNEIVGMTTREQQLCIKIAVRMRSRSHLQLDEDDQTENIHRSVYLIPADEQQRDDWLDLMNLALKTKADPSKSTTSAAQSTAAEESLLQHLGFIQADDTSASMNLLSGTPADVQGKVKVHPVSSGMDGEDLKGLFSVFGDIVDVELKQANQGKQTAIITFKKQRAAELALKLNKASLGGEIINVSIVREEEVKGSTVLRVRNFSFAIMNKAEFRAIFEVFGRIELIRFFPPANSAQDGKWEALIKFVQKQAADQAQQLNGSRLFGETVDIELVQAPIGTEEEELFFNTLDPVLIRESKQKVLIRCEPVGDPAQTRDKFSRNDKMGSKNVRASMAEIRADIFDPNLSFVLDCGARLYQWNGRLSTRFTRAKALDIASNIRVKERQGNAKLFIFDEEKRDEEKKDKEQERIYNEFVKQLGGQPSFSAIAPQSPSSPTSSSSSSSQALNGPHCRLVRVGIQANQSQQRSAAQMAVDGNRSLPKPFENIRIKVIHDAPIHAQGPSKTLLQSDYVFVLDCFTELYIWEGRGADVRQKAFAAKMAARLFSTDLDGSSRPSWATVTRLPESAETILFKEKWCDWGGGILPIAVGAGDLEQTRGNIAEAVKQPSSEELVQMLFEQRKLPDENDEQRAATRALEDDDISSQGQILAMYRVDGFEKSTVPQDERSQFWSGDSYIIVYQYRKGNRDKKVVFFWQGRDCSVNEKGASALLTKEIYDESGGEAVQMREEQQKESKYFFVLFPNGIIVHYGKKQQQGAAAPAPGANAARAPQQSLPPSTVDMYDVRAIDQNRVRSVQVPIVDQRELNSNHVFVLRNSKTNALFIWQGNNSLPAEVSMAWRTVQIISGGKKQPTTVKEGQESSDFWRMFPSGATPSARPASVPRRASNVWLYRFSIGKGAVFPERITQFTQDDLEMSDVIVLDAVDKVYIWLGRDATFKTQKIAAEAILCMVKNDKEAKRPRNPESTVFLVDALNEPFEFRRYFHAWSLFRERSLREAQVPLMLAHPADDSSLLTPISKKLAEYQRQTYSYNQLLAAEELPASVDRSQLELYLPENEFRLLFEMTREQFSALPAWKQKSLKQKAYLY